jgi:hypothetical protein
MLTWEIGIHYKEEFLQRRFEPKYVDILANTPKHIPTTSKLQELLLLLHRAFRCFIYLHTQNYALVSYIIKLLKDFIHLTAPTCFDTQCVIIRERLFS